jgi:hypothetical protein
MTETNNGEIRGFFAALRMTNDIGILELAGPLEECFEGFDGGLYAALAGFVEEIVLLVG